MMMSNSIDQEHTLDNDNNSNHHYRNRIPVQELLQPPKPANATEVAAIAQHGIIGQCLYGALQDVLESDKLQKEKDVNTEEASSLDNETTITAEITAAVPHFQLHESLVNNVRKEFGQAVARTKWTFTTDPTSTSRTASKTSSSTSVVPPPALLIGRLNHYNRFHGKWRIVLSQAQFKRRTILPKYRKKKSRRLLWNAVDDRTAADQSTTSSAPTTIQLLAYDDTT